MDSKQQEEYCSPILVRVECGNDLCEKEIPKCSVCNEVWPCWKFKETHGNVRIEKEKRYAKQVYERGYCEDD